MTFVRRLERATVERAARIYRSNEAAALALGVTAGAFGRACRSFGIPIPFQRKKQEQLNRQPRKED